MDAYICLLVQHQRAGYEVYILDPFESDPEVRQQLASRNLSSCCALVPRMSFHSAITAFLVHTILSKARDLQHLQMHCARYRLIFWSDFSFACVISPSLSDNASPGQVFLAVFVAHMPSPFSITKGQSSTCRDISV